MPLPCFLMESVQFLELYGEFLHYTKTVLSLNKNRRKKFKEKKYCDFPPSPQMKTKNQMTFPARCPSAAIIKVSM